MAHGAKVPGLTGIDTRALTKRIRDRGAMLARIEFEPTFAETASPSDVGATFEDPMARNLIAEVSCAETTVYGEGNPLKILALDCGIKYNMIRHLVSRGCEVKRVPWDHDITKEVYDGLFLSNGPGNPAMAGLAVERVSAILEERAQPRPRYPSLAYAWATSCSRPLRADPRTRCASATGGRISPSSTS